MDTHLEILASINHLKPNIVQIRKVGRNPPKNNNYNLLFERMVFKFKSSIILINRKYVAARGAHSL